MNYYISDIHFGHQNAIHFDQRPFSDWKEMDETLIQFWNAKVRDKDDVYIVGDLCFRNTYPEEWYLSKLRGKKHLIIGNHDGKLLSNPEAMKYFETVEKMMHVFDGHRQICLSHFPIAEWNGFHKGHWHIYGHIHNRRDETYEFMKTRERALNAGCMINGYAPVTFEELLQNNLVYRTSEVPKNTRAEETDTTEDE